MASNDDVMFMLGEIKGQLDGIEKQQKTESFVIGNIDSRLREVEKSSAVHGAVGGGIAGIGVSLIIASLKEAFKSQGA